MISYFSSYLAILVFFMCAIGLSLIILILPRLLAKHKYQKAKLMSYECGFDEIDRVHKKFDVRFYLVAILFIIFDLEIAFLAPWAMKVKHLSNLGFWSMMLFILVLTVGFVYEWKKGALELD